MELKGFVGPTNPNYSLNADAERTINLIVEPGETGTPKVGAALYSRPGTIPHLTLADSPIRALFAQNGRCFAVAGGTFYELFASQTAIARGFVNMDGNPATLCSNGDAGHQVLVISAGFGWIFDLTANTFTKITDASFPTFAVMGVFSDGYFIVLDNTGTIHLSALEDGTSWGGNDVGPAVAQRSTASDRSIAIAISHREIWWFGGQTTEPWTDTGAADFPYAPVSGTLIEHGIIAPWSVAVLDNTLYWLGSDDHGAGVVYKAQGYSPVKVSSFALDSILQRIYRMDDAIGWAAQIYGHLFYVLYLPQNDTSWVYDVAANAWTEWAHWNDTLICWVPFRGRCHCYAFGWHLIGDYGSGNVYQLREDLYLDYSIVP